MADKLVTIAQFTDSAQASLAKQLLADFGIESVLTGQNAANIYTIPALATTSLQTFESQSKRAQELLESNKKQEP
jgi:hypothetical protein